MTVKCIVQSEMLYKGETKLTSSRIGEKILVCQGKFLEEPFKPPNLYSDG